MRTMILSMKKLAYLLACAPNTEITESVHSRFLRVNESPRKFCYTNKYSCFDIVKMRFIPFLNNDFHKDRFNCITLDDFRFDIESQRTNSIVEILDGILFTVFLRNNFNDLLGIMRIVCFQNFQVTWTTSVI